MVEQVKKNCSIQPIAYALDRIRCHRKTGKNGKTAANQSYQKISGHSPLERTGRHRSYSCRHYICISGYSLAVQEEKQALEILRRRSAKDRQRHRQKRQTKTGKITTALGKQSYPEKRDSRRCPDRYKPKTKYFQNRLRKDGAKWHNPQQRPPHGCQETADRDVGHVEKKLSVRPGQSDFIKTD